MKTENFIRVLVADLPSRPDHPGRALPRWLVASAGLAGTAFLLVAGTRTDMFGPGLLPTVLKVLLGALLAWAAIGGAKTLARPEARPWQGIWRLAVIAAFFMILLVSDLVSHGSDGWLVRLFGKNFLFCLTVIPTLSLLPLLASLHAMRTGATTSPTTAGALTGLASAGMAIMAYGLFCTEDSPAFFATWYLLAAAIVAGVGAVLGRILLRW